MANRVLIVSYAFPPAAMVGVHRWLALSKYLPEHGCETWVLAPRNAVGSAYDPALLGRIGREVHVVRAFTPELPFRFRKWLWGLVMRRASPPDTEADAEPAVSKPVATKPAAKPGLLRRLAKSMVTPEPQAVWLPFARRKALRTIRRNAIDTVIFTGPPYSPLLMVPDIRRSFPQVRIVLDFRDEWIEFYLRHFELTEERKDNVEICRRIEKAAVDAADLVLAVNDAQIDIIRARYSQQPAQKFRVLPNGYDPEVFKPLPAKQNGGDIVITSVGTILPMTFPGTLFEAIDLLQPDVAARIRLRFIGRVVPECADVVAKASQTRAEFLGFMPQDKAYEYVKETDILLTVVRDDTAHGGKFFEYLATRKPILALTPPAGELGQLMRSTNAGWCVDPDDIAGIRDALLDSLTRMPQSVTSEVEKYDRRVQAGELAQWVGQLQHSTKVH